jgi:hypothetical protein
MKEHISMNENQIGNESRKIENTKKSSIDGSSSGELGKL